MLEDGAVLAPALPPSSATTGPPPSLLQGRVERRSMRIEGMRVGNAVLALRVSVEAEGVQIDVEHLSGEGVRVAVAIPRDPRFDFSEEYVDWYRQEEKGIAHVLQIAPADEEHTLYARFEPRAPAWPTRPPETVPAQIEHGGVRIAAGRDDPDLALLEAVAASLAQGPLRLDASLREPSEGSGTLAGIQIDLSDPAERPAKLAWIAAAVERRALGPMRRGR